MRSRLLPKYFELGKNSTDKGDFWKWCSIKLDLQLR